MSERKVEVYQLDDATWGFECSGPGCGAAPGDGFYSEGWPTKKAATERSKQHLEEHGSGEPAPLPMG